MKKINSIVIVASIIFSLSACNSDRQFDASGSFEAEETIISSEASGVIRQFDLEEGQTLKANQMIGYVDSMQLYLKKEQLEAQIKALLVQKPNISVQLATLQSQLKAAQKEQKRIENLVKSNAATTKQLDDVNAQVEFINKQINALQSSLQISTEGINKGAQPLQYQIDQLNDQLKKCRLINPIKGTILTKYAEANEMTAPGKPIYKIADMSSIILRAYISGNQLPMVKLGQKVKVYTDDGKSGFNETEGTITWISDKAEFTPKTIQTKDERANMVYALKVKVKNDGTYKIGMYGEINFE